MKNWKYILALAVLILFFGLYIKGYNYGANADNSNIRLKEEVDADNPVLSEKVYNYYICVEDNYIIVYEKDRKTVYMDTGISLDDVNISDIESIMNGVPVEDITTLYRYLESYTS